MAIETNERERSALKVDSTREALNRRIDDLLRIIAGENSDPPRRRIHDGFVLIRKEPEPEEIEGEGEEDYLPNVRHYGALNGDAVPLRRAKDGALHRPVRQSEAFLDSRDDESPPDSSKREA